MSNTQYAFLKKQSVPDRQTLQAWIDDLGFDLKLDPELDLKADEGFSPCRLDGAEGIGFELESSASEEVADGDEDVLEMAGGRDFCISMTWRSSMKDCAAVMIVSCALAKHCDAVISYECGEPEAFEQMLAHTADILIDAHTDL